MTLMEPRTRRFTRAEYYKMADVGLFEGQRVELIAGEILTMSPHNSLHAWTIAIIHRWLSKVLPDSCWARCQLPLIVGDNTEPEPDFAIISGPPESQTAHPRTALLVIEVAHTTLPYDRRKAPMYASIAVPEYWIVNLLERTVEVYTKPVSTHTEEFPATYQQRTVYQANEIVTAAALPLPPVRAGELMAKE